MAVKYYCDNCGKGPLTPDNAFIEGGELTLGEDNKISIRCDVEVSNRNHTKNETPALCYECLLKSVLKWGERRGIQIGNGGESG
jgi:hypothetical protein